MCFVRPVGTDAEFPLGIYRILQPGRSPAVYSRPHTHTDTDTPTYTHTHIHKQCITYSDRLIIVTIEVNSNVYIHSGILNVKEYSLIIYNYDLIYLI